MTGSPLPIDPFVRALSGQYAIQREVGRGGMGVVYLAHDLKLDRDVAIKTLPPQLASDPVIRERFLREARTAAALSHPNIVPIHRADEIDGHVFFVMGYVAGPPLSQMIREGGPLRPRTAVSILRDVAEALDYAHTMGVVHRDVKAENILIDQASGRALVTDFGIARVAEAAPLTATGTVLGTVHYMSPEQVAGEGVDPRSDIYSLGVVAFFALSGRFPFESPTASAVLVAHVTRAAPSLAALAPTVPGSLAAVVDRCLAKDPADRFQSCGELVETLDRVDAMLPADDVPAPPPGDPVAISSTEAQELWHRAAELQDMTRPLAPLQRPAPDQLARRRAEPLSAGYQLDQVREAAKEAGIGEQFMRRALAEHGIGARDPGTVEVRPGIGPRKNAFLGSPTSIALEAIVPGEMLERDFEVLVDDIRRALNEPGIVSSIGRTLTWSSTERRRRVQVSVMVRDGRTAIHAGEQLRDIAGGLFGGIMGGGGGGTIGPSIAFTMGALHAPWLIAPIVLANVSVMYGIARTIFGRVSRSHREVLEQLVRRMAEHAQESVARRTVGSGGRREQKLLR